MRLRGPRTVGGPRWGVVGPPRGRTRLRTSGDRPGVPPFAVQRGPVQDVGQFVDGVRQTTPSQSSGCTSARNRLPDRSGPKHGPRPRQLRMNSGGTDRGTGWCRLRSFAMSRIPPKSPTGEGCTTRGQPGPVQRSPGTAGRRVDQGGEVTHLRGTPFKLLQPTPFGQRDEDDFLAVVAGVR